MTDPAKVLTLPTSPASKESPSPAQNPSPPPPSPPPKKSPAEPKALPLDPNKDNIPRLNVAASQLDAALFEEIELDLQPEDRQNLMLTSKKSFNGLSHNYGTLSFVGESSEDIAFAHQIYEDMDTIWVQGSAYSVLTIHGRNNQSEDNYTIREPQLVAAVQMAIDMKVQRVEFIRCDYLPVNIVSHLIHSTPTLRYLYIRDCPGLEISEMSEHFDSQSITIDWVPIVIRGFSTFKAVSVSSALWVYLYRFLPQIKVTQPHLLSDGAAFRAFLLNGVTGFQQAPLMSDAFQDLIDATPYPLASKGQDRDSESAKAAVDAHMATFTPALVKFYNQLAKLDGKVGLTDASQSIPLDCSHCLEQFPRFLFPQKSQRISAEQRRDALCTYKEAHEDFFRNVKNKGALSMLRTNALLAEITRDKRQLSEVKKIASGSSPTAQFTGYKLSKSPLEDVEITNPDAVLFSFDHLMTSVDAFKPSPLSFTKLGNPTKHVSFAAQTDKSSKWGSSRKAKSEGTQPDRFAGTGRPKEPTTITPAGTKNFTWFAKKTPLATDTEVSEDPGSQLTSEATSSASDCPVAPVVTNVPLFRQVGFRNPTPSECDEGHYHSTDGATSPHKLDSPKVPELKE